MCCRLQRIITILVASVALGSSGPATAEIDVGGQVTITTDYVFRGVSQTMSGAALQGELGIEGDSGWYGYAWASNVDFTDSNAPDDGARLELNLGAGYARSINDSLTVSLEATAYIFPDTEAGFDYDYEEWHGSLNIDDRHELTVSYSDNVFGSGSNGVFYAARTGLDLSEQVYLGVEFGRYNLENSYDISYNYSVLSVAGSANSVDWQLSYLMTTDEAKEIFYESTVSNRFVLALTRAF